MLLLRIWRHINGAVKGGESWYAAWQAIKTELRERWPDAIPYIGALISAVWTWLTDAAAPWVAFIAVSTFVVLYVGRVAAEFRHNYVGVRPDISPASSSTQSFDTSPIADRLSELEQRLVLDIVPTLSGVSDQLQSARKTLECLDNEMLVVLDYSSHGLTSHMLMIAKEAKPSEVADVWERESITEEWIDEQISAIDTYVHYVMAFLGKTRWAPDLRAEFTQAEVYAKHQISRMPHDERPAHIDPYKFQDYFIAKTRYDFISRALDSMKSESIDAMNYYLERLKVPLHKRTAGIR